jgi:predicted dehydrogenase
MNGLSPNLNCVALAEPDAGNPDRALKRLADGAEKAGVKGFDPARIKTFSDYRAMYDQAHKEIDLVLIATPDHQHACPSMMAIKLGKHVYCEKPLVHRIAEARALGEAARQSPVVTQMGNQGSGTGGHQAVAEWLEAGAIGKLREVHAWHIFASRFGGSMPKPEPQPAHRGWTGTPGSVRPKSGRSVPFTGRGTAGATSAPARWAAGARTSWTPRASP